LHRLAHHGHENRSLRQNAWRGPETLRRGRGLHLLGDRIVNAPAGTFLHGPRSIRHAFFNRGNAAARVQILAIPSGIERFFEEIGEPVTVPQGDAPAVDADNMAAVAERYGIHFEPLP
jgi:hypothetical protein